MPLAVAGAGERAGERRGERDDLVRRPDRDRGRCDAVHAPARERDELRLPPPPVVGERGAPVLLGVGVGAVQRAVPEGARDVARRAGAAPSTGRGTGPSAPGRAGRTGAASGGRRRTRRAGRGRGRRAARARPAGAGRRRSSGRAPGAVGRVSVHTSPSEVASVTIAQSRQMPAIAQTLKPGCGEAPVVALERDAVRRGGGRRPGRRRPCGDRAALSERSRRG